MKPISYVAILCGILLVLLCYADRQESDEQARIRDAQAVKQQKARDARQVEWVDLNKVGRFMTAFDNIEQGK